jgi:hypothetical protein
MSDGKGVEEKFEGETFDEGDILEGQDLKINPDFFIHMAVLKSQQALLKDNLKEGLMQYRLLVEQVEIVCRSAGIVDDKSYEESLKRFKDKEDYKDERDALVQHALLAGEKLRLLLEFVFGNRVSTNPMRM